eukprot:scaffold26270_cov60-Attheya_sp.AAC.1
MGVQTPVRQDKLPSSKHIAEVFTGILSEDPSKSDECAKNQRNHHSRVNPKKRPFPPPPLKGGGKGRKPGAGVWGEAEIDLAFSIIIEVLLPAGDESWEEADVKFYNKGKDRGYNRTGNAIRAHFHNKDIKRDIDKEEVIGYANLNDNAIAFCEVTSENRSGMTGTNLVDDDGEVRPPSQETPHIRAANAISKSVALIASKVDDSAQEQRLSNIERKVDQILSLLDVDGTPASVVGVKTV